MTHVFLYTPASSVASKAYGTEQHTKNDGGVSKIVVGETLVDDSHPKVLRFSSEFTIKLSVLQKNIYVRVKPMLV